LAISSQPAHATVESDQAQIARLERQIAAQGENVKSLVTRFDEAQARLDDLNSQITRHQRQLVADQAAETDATSRMRGIAVRAYVAAGGSTSPELAMFSDNASTVNLFEQTSYLAAVNGKWNDALTALQLDRARTRDAQDTLQSEEKNAEATVSQLTKARDSALAAIASQSATLSRVRTDLRAQVAAAAAVAEKRREAQLAAAPARATTPRPRQSPVSPPIAAPSPPPAPSSPPPPPPPAPPVPTTGPGQYVNPLRGVSALTPERIDQGVDYSGFGSIYAIGNGVVLSTYGGGWPGGTFIAYRLTDGPAAGLVVYAAEDIAPSVQVGASVNSNTVLGQVYAGPDGIETGWADGSALPNTMARTFGQFNGGNSTAFGDNFSRLLQSVGAPGGVLQNNPPTGSLPDSWPRW
jgi:hypothetical protein